MNAPSNRFRIQAVTRIAQDLNAIVDSVLRSDSKWRCVPIKDLASLPKQAGVYCIVVPRDHMPADPVLWLHGRTFGSKERKRQYLFKYHYEAQVFKKGAGVVLYVGKAANLRQRLKNHLSSDPKATTNQVLKGLASTEGPYPDQSKLMRAKNNLLDHGSVWFHKHAHPNESEDPRTNDEMGESLVAERDLLEIKLIARYAPPFNIKAER